MADPGTKTVTEHGMLPNSEAADGERLRRMLDNRSAPTEGGLVIETLAGPEMAGFIGFSGGQPVQRSARLTLLIGPLHRGRGLGSEALRVFQRFAFQELGLHRLELSVFVFNPAAIRAYRRAGFVEEGRLREVVLRAGRWHDAVLMSILEPEWRERRDVAGDAEHPG